MEPLGNAVDALAAETAFSGVVRVDRAGTVEVEKAYGLADRGHGIPNAVDTQFALASGTKGLTALTVVRLIQDGALELTTTARSVLGEDLPLIVDGVTIEHLLAHRSGIGDWLDEETEFEITDYLMPVAVHRLATTQDYIAANDGYQTAFAPGTRFAYNNSGFVVLGVIAERVSGTPFHDLVHRSVCEPAGMNDTAFLRSDELPGRAALGYLDTEGPRTNVFHLPVRGHGDGGVYSTAADVAALWGAFFAGRIVSPHWVAEMIRPRSDVPKEQRRYGLGFWLHETSDVVMLEGYDSGVSFSTGHDPVTATTSTVISNTSEGAWPFMRLFEDVSADGRARD